jgi:signal transduction histidine kinase
VTSVDPSDDPEVASQVLAEAARAVLLSMPVGVGVTGADPESVEHVLQLLIGAVEGRSVLQTSSLSSPELLLHFTILQALRRELLEQRAVEGQQDQLLELLASVEMVQQNLERSAPHNSPIATLTSLRGPELMVELAHDLRSPLTSILFLAESLRSGQGGPLSELQRSQLGIIYSAALAVVSVAGDVVDLARGGDSLVELQETTFSLGEILNSVVDVARPLVESKTVNLQARVVADHDRRRGYPAAISRVLLNLVTNALRFTSEGSVSVVAKEVAPALIEFSVTDTGRGIRPESMMRLFQPFRARPTRDRIGISGAGLGLTICKRLVEAMGGELSIASELGAGTTFQFTLAIPAADTSAEKL